MTTLFHFFWHFLTFVFIIKQDEEFTIPNFRSETLIPTSEFLISNFNARRVCIQIASNLNWILIETNLFQILSPISCSKCYLINSNRIRIEKNRFLFFRMKIRVNIGMKCEKIIDKFIHWNYSFFEKFYLDLLLRSSLMMLMII